METYFTLSKHCVILQTLWERYFLMLPKKQAVGLQFISNIYFKWAKYK